MSRRWQAGRWLLIDAAGPGLITGIIENGEWLVRGSHSGGFLESLKPGVASLLEKAALELSDLNGVICSTGPGSTLGLRLAAMFVRGLLQQPALRHWQCLTYNNLQLACAGEIRSGSGECRLIAPWRRDRLHKVTFDPGPPPQFALAAVSPDEAKGLPAVALGNRGSSLRGDFPRVDYPADRIPQILGKWPTLLTSTRQPELYSAETTEFAKWTSTRHPQK